MGGHLSLAAAAVAVQLSVALLVAQPSGAGFLRKPSADALRLMTWNIGSDSIFPQPGQPVDPERPGRPSQFARIVRAVRPDVLCLQEVRVGAARTAALIDEVLPLRGGKAWHAHAVLDNVIVSRFGISARGGAIVRDGPRERGHAIALVDVSDAWARTAIYMVCAHFQSTGGPENVAMRERQADTILSAIREAKAGRGDVPLPPRTPFVILGDLNAIPGATHFLDAILSGTAAPAAAAGAAAPGAGGGPDWDGSPITDALPPHNGSGPLAYTWRDDLDRFAPSALDRVLYSDSVLIAANAFVLDTTSLPYEELKGAGLRSTDVMRDPLAGVHDHFPIVVDFVIGKDSAR